MDTGNSFITWGSLYSKGTVSGLAVDWKESTAMDCLKFIHGTRLTACAISAIFVESIDMSIF